VNNISDIRDILFGRRKDCFYFFLIHYNRLSLVE